MKRTLTTIGAISALLLFVAAGCYSSSNKTTTTTTGTGNSVTMSSLAFSPTNLTVKTGTSVTWTNNDSVAHTIIADDGSFASGSVSNGQSFSHTFSTAGTFTYHCSIHPSMTGTITVTQ